MCLKRRYLVPNCCMGIMNFFKRLLWGALCIIGCCSFIRPQSPPPKAYAVFVVTYDGSRAIGGIAGTAFFISPTRAITASHVLNHQSFIPRPGFLKTRIWLVHEGEPAIELYPDSIKTNEERDQTHIQSRVEVPAKYVYQPSGSPVAGTHVVTEGFIANSSGPTLERINGEIEITSVPSLKRYREEGVLLDLVRVQVRAADVNLDFVPCLQLSYRPIVGFSGGPVIYQGKVVAMNSFAEPQKRNSTFAVQLKQ